MGFISPVCSLALCFSIVLVLSLFQSSMKLKKCLEALKGKESDCLFALKASPNGDCLFNAFSILLCGNESLAVPLCLLVAGELYFNASFYANHDAFNETATNSTDLTVDILFSIALSKVGDKKLLETGIKSEAVRTETLVVYQTRMVFIHTYPGSRLCGFKASTFCLS